MGWVIEEMMAEEIREKGVTLTFVAKKTGIKYAVLQSCMKQKRKLRLEEFFTICDFLQIDPDQFRRKVAEGCCSAGAGAISL